MKKRHGNCDTDTALGRPPRPAAAGATDQNGQVQGPIIQGRTECAYSEGRARRPRRFDPAPPDDDDADRNDDDADRDDDGRANGSRREESIGHVTGDDLDRFLDVYRLITSRDPGADEAVDAATAERLLVGDGWRTSAAESASDGDGDDDNGKTTDSDNETTDSDGDDRVMLDVFERVGRWMKPLRPTVGRVESMAREYETIVERTPPWRPANTAGPTVATTRGPTISRAFNHTDRRVFVFQQKRR